MTREEFMDIVYSELHSDDDNYRTNRIIDAADEYAEEHKEWISCSERLPEKSEWYVVTVNVENEPVVYLRWYSELHGWNWDKQNKTIAWMPLPKPYREESEGEK